MRPFADVLRDLSRGETYDTLTTEMAEVAAAVIATGKQGSITLKLSFKANGENSIIVTDDIKTVIPKPKRPDSLFFATSSGALLREDPDRETKPRAVAGPTMPEFRVAKEG